MLVLLVFIGLCVVLTASSVSAASNVYVNATGGSDSNTGTIESPYQTIYQGISSVDENGTVQIADGVYTGTNNTNITITKNVNINGQSQTGTIINGTDINWIFHINNGFTVTIQNLTISNGRSSNGAAIYNEGNSTVVDSTFIENTVTTYGGAIYNDNSGILTVAGCTFTNNTAEAGGAIFNLYATIHDVTGCAFTNNTAVIAGGAICNVYGTTNNVTGCTFTNNTVTGTIFGGGALYSFGEGSGGSIKNVTGCTFTGNHAIVGGGAIHNDWGSSMVIHFNSFFGNTATLGNVISNSGNSVNATDNWWGSNNPVWTDLIAGMSNPSEWLYMILDLTPTTINNTQTSLVTASFNNFYDGTTFDPSIGHIPDGTVVTYSCALGSFDPAITKTIDGIATALFTANQTGTDINITATTDNQTFTQLITVNPASYLYLNVTNSKTNPTTGEIFVITYKLSNSGPDNATNVTMSFQIPDGLEFVNATLDNGTWTYNPVNRTVTWTLDNVAVGDPYLYLTVKSLGTGNYTITTAITSETFNGNTDPLMPFSIGVEAQDNSNNFSNNTVNAASTTKTVPMQTTGMPIAGLVLAILAVLGGIFTPRKK